jgi:hypothetical protein
LATTVVWEREKEIREKKVVETADNDSTLPAQLAKRDADLILAYIFNNYKELGDSPLSLD